MGNRWVAGFALESTSRKELRQMFPCFPFYVHQLRKLVIKLLIQNPPPQNKVYNILKIFYNPN